MLGSGNALLPMACRSLSHPVPPMGLSGPPALTGEDTRPELSKALQLTNNSARVASDSAPLHRGEDVPRRPGDRSRPSVTHAAHPERQEGESPPPAHAPQPVPRSSSGKTAASHGRAAGPGDSGGCRGKPIAPWPPTPYPTPSPGRARLRGGGSTGRWGTSAARRGEGNGDSQAGR